VLLTAQYDAENQFILRAKFAWNYWGKHISKSDVREYIIDMLEKAG